MKPYDKITKKELYQICVNAEITELERQLTPHEYTPATMYHSHKGGWVGAENKHLLIGGSNPHIPDLSTLSERYGNSDEAAEGYRLQLVKINKQLSKLKEQEGSE